MTVPPIPVIFEPHFKPKPWGGRRLAALFGKHLPPDQPIGESWEVVSLPGAESRVRAGVLAGRTVSELMALWGRDFYGAAELAEGRFPLLIKFLDAREALSVQVHPKPDPKSPAGWQPGVKHEAWYVVEAEPGAELLLGLEPGILGEQLRKAAQTSAIAKLLRHWPVQAGQAYYLPSGTAHALGAGLVVLEVQTPSDVTYRLYDWDRKAADGTSRELHIEAALQNLCLNVPDEIICQVPRPVAAGPLAAVRLAACERFTIDKVQINAAAPMALPPAEMTIWGVLSGQGVLTRGPFACPYAAGDVVVVPADNAEIRLLAATPGEALLVRVPGREKVDIGGVRL